MVLVDGRPARRVRGATYELPTRDGRGLHATVAPGRRMSPYPRLVVDGQEHATGPAPPAGLTLLAIAPAGAVLLGGLGMFLVLAGLASTLVVLRRPWSLRARYAAVVAVDLACAVLGVGVARVNGWL
jgi:hypothetical protein